MIGNVAIDFILLYRIAPIDLECINTILWYIIKNGQYAIFLFSSLEILHHQR